MRLQQVSLRGRRFLIQFSAIMEEFGGVIPWLASVRELSVVTSGTHFEKQLLERLRQPTGGITAYQFVGSDRSREFMGGLLHFKRTPERFEDHPNKELVEAFEEEGMGYISCLQVLPNWRGTGVGRDLMTRALNAILQERGAVWGVVSDPNLVHWYRSLGASILSPDDKADNFWIVVWRRDGTQP